MISVVIPTHNSERALVPTLAALVPGVTGGILRDVILADGGSSDDTAAIADAAGCVFLPGLADLGTRLKQGAAQARGRWILFLHPYSLLEEGWVREVSSFLERAERRGAADLVAATFRLSVDGYGFRPRLGEAVAAARLAVTGRPRPGQGLLLSARHYERLGGHGPGAGAERRLIARIGLRRLHVLRASILLPEAIPAGKL
ncbi:glycosyltransferase [Aquabacter cavernae]|uniref:glycosyltransferase n=1 Tax=Aquabacter cavernae TaxID=2496029 RepID=UPI000F8F2077|nr:glycosyltransferase [Aquabacter cavernae]